MGLETGTGIGDLVPTNPLSTDAVSVGDDHIRLIKTVMQSITGNFRSIQTFKTSGTWTRPANIKKILIYCLGGGSGGGGTPVAGYGGAGGSSGGVGIKWLDVTAITTATVTIGAGGTGGALGGASGGAGGDTLFITAGPINQCVGKGGNVGPNYNSGGEPSAGNVGDITFMGAYGATGDVPNATAANGGQGGGLGAKSGSVAYPNTGGGGGGGQATPGLGFAGAAGGSGYSIVFEFGW